MQALKFLVIVMAILILGGMGLLAYGLATRLDSGGAVFEAIELPLPPGCTIAGTEVSENRLVLRFDGLAERGCQQVVVVDMTTGRILGQVRGVPPSE
ncbi:hypothetical protein [Pelagibius sp.]|uniref:hypothetical protein n=1 Tax=Pelagibius sp. TaxID=1931238 RepID=UPI00261C60EF|nr:hypothetical protein [Pelagibius sp.]